MNKQTQIIISVIALSVVAGGAFYGGMFYKGSQIPQRNSQRAGVNGARFQTGASFVNGTVLSMDNQSIAVKGRDGSSRIVFYSGTTEVGKFVNGATSDLKNGENITVTGKVNSDGSITAQSIQIRPPLPAGSPQPGQ